MTENNRSDIIIVYNESKYGINSFQGYYYSKPISSEEIIAKY